MIVGIRKRHHHINDTDLGLPVQLTLPLSGRQGLGNAGWESMVACPLEGRVIRSSMP